MGRQRRGNFMSDRTSIDRAQTYIDCQLELGIKPSGWRKALKKQPSVTISRQAGAGGLTVADDLAEYLQKHAPKPSVPWTVFDRNLVDVVLKKLNLPARLAAALPEDRVSYVSDMVEELLGLHPPSDALIRQMSATILHLADMGNVILIGRGANVITAKLENVLHVRLVGSVEKRIERVMAYYHLGRKAAAAFVEQEDSGRRRYLKKNFGKEIEDPLLYHLVINTDRITRDAVTSIVGQAVIEMMS